MRASWKPWCILTTFLLLARNCESDVRMPPIITDYPTSTVLFNSEQTATLPCVATGIPSPSYKWTKNGVELEFDDRVTRPDPDTGTVVITEAYKSFDNGVYICIATNSHGVALSPVITVSQTEIDFESKTIPVEITRTEGDALKLELFDSVTSVPSVSYEWKTVTEGSNEGDRLITNTRIAVDQSTGSLYFANLETSDQLANNLLYKLDARNTFEDTTVGGSPYKLIVNANPDKVNQSPMRMVPETDNFQFTALKGRDETIKCFFGGLPTPTVTWRTPINGPPPSRLQCNQESGTECLILNAQYTDEGIYTCTGTNSEGSVSYDINFVVESVPTFATAPSSKNVTAGTSGSFICIPDAKPDASITWYSNGNVVNRDNPGSSRMFFSDDNTNLTVMPVCKDCDGAPNTDLQVLQCKISNTQGDAYASAYLNVIEPVVIYDTGPSQEIIVDPDLGEAMIANFTCRATTDELVLDNLAIAWWYRDLVKVSNNTIYEILNSGENLNINLENIPDDKVTEYLGDYTCVAGNGYYSARELYVFEVRGYEAVAASIADFWWVFLLIFLLLLLLLLVICCVMYMKKNKGEDYPVDYYEKYNGNDPIEECKDADFHDYHRPIDAGNLKESKASLGSNEHLDDDNVSSLYGYDNDAGKFSEEGSFVGQYNTYNRPTISVPGHAVSNA